MRHSGLRRSLVIALCGVGALAAITPSAVAAARPAASSSCKPRFGAEPGGKGTALGIVTVSACDVWLVGGSGAGSAGFADHWTGSSWKATPFPSAASAELAGAAATTATHVIAVGDILTSQYASGAESYAALWNGSKWTRTALPVPAGWSALSSVAAAGAGHAWAAGSYFTQATSYIYQSLAEYWDGSAWRMYTDPVKAYSSDLDGDAVVSSNRTWFVGEYQTSSTGKDQALATYWNGSSFIRVAAPTVSGWNTELDSVSGTSASNAWAVGAAWSGNSTRAVAERWNGAKWLTVTLPSAARGDWLSAVDVISPTNVWIAGTGHRGVVLHWSNGSWNIITEAKALGLGAVSGSAADVWVGGVMLSTFEPFAEHM
jgi:hypothetical protein